MELRSKRIVLFSPEPWDGLHMSKHHVSQALVARGNEVVFVDPPADVSSALETVRRGDVTVVRYRHWLRGVNSMPRFVNQWYYRRLIDRIAERTGGGFDIIWTFDTSRMQWFPEGREFKLLYLADHDILHMGGGLIPSADLVLTTSQIVADEVTHRAGAGVVNVGHSIDPRWVRGSEHLGHREITAPTDVAFAGQLATKYNDWDGFDAIAAAYPGMRFTFIGPFDESFPDPAFHTLRARPNVSFTGLMDKDSLVSRLREAHVLLFGFRSQLYAKERANPHKILEYLSTGNVIVGSYTMEYAKRSGLFCMAQQGGSLLDEFRNAMTRFHELNAPEARRTRLSVAQGRTLNDVLSRIETAMAD